MLLLRISLFAALGFGFNTATASDILETTGLAYYQGTPPQAGKTGSRRRGDCGTPPDAWAIDFCEKGSFCYVDGQPVKLWLPKEKRSGRSTDRVTIKNTDTKNKETVTWPREQPTLLWPVDDMPIQSGTTYKIKLKKGRDYFSRKITLYKIDKGLSRSEQVFEMRQTGCDIQADLLEDQTG